jgi:hypothetical protein
VVHYGVDFTERGDYSISKKLYQKLIKNQ